MLILASILLSRASDTNDSFSSTPDAVFSPSFPRDADPTPPCPRQRIQIIWTCVATILAASWVSVHPNIPDAKESKIKKMLRRIELMIWAILTPELIIFWAMRQWRGARYMEREFAEARHIELESMTRKLLRWLKELGYKLRLRRNTPLKPETPRWTRTHGFFLQMGGFMLREDGKKDSDRVLGWKTLMEYYNQGRLDLSDITEDRINDHSKADGFAKGLALLQMLLTSFSAAALFGSIHCIGWSSKIVFTSQGASLAWRIASATITISPVVWSLYAIFGYAYKTSQNGSALERMSDYLQYLFRYASIATIPVYIVARLTLLVLAFVELRNVPPGALTNIHWANVLPFIH